MIDGITRAIVLDLSARNGVMVQEGKFPPEDLFTASEVFITNTSMEVMPVRRVDDKRFKVGEIARLLLRKYREEVSGLAHGEKSQKPVFVRIINSLPFFRPPL